MLFGFRHTDLSRWLASHFLLASAAALAWMVISAVFVTWFALRTQADTHCRAQLDKAAALITATDLAPAGRIRDSLPGTAGGVQPDWTPWSATDEPGVSADKDLVGAALQSKVERLQLEGDVHYCAVVSPHGEIVAHSTRELLGTTHREPAAEHEQLDQVTRLRYSPEDSDISLIEYRSPIRYKQHDVGTLHVAVVAPKLWDVIQPALKYGPLVTLGPVVCLLLGSLFMTWKLRAISGVVRELGRVAVAVSPSEVDLQQVSSGGPAAVGWNRLVAFFHQLDTSSSAKQRMERGLNSLLKQQGNDVLNSVPEGFAITDRDSCISFANRALAALCQINQSDGKLEGRKVAQCLALEDQGDAVAELLNPRAEGRAAVAEFQRSAGGSPQVLRVARYPLKRKDGQAGSGYVWTIRDVTQQRLAAKMRDEFLHTATHELRTPLANIKAYAETLDMEEGIDVQQQKQFLNTISSEATRLSRLVDDLLNVSSMEVGSLALTVEETDIERIFAEVVDKVKAEIDRKEIKFEKKYPAKWPKMHLDKDKITTSLVNVLGNAVKYTPAGGRVSLRVAMEDRNVIVRVDDTGVGISAEELPRVFDKFFRSSDPRVQDETGSGLGLSLVKEVVRLHGGTMEVKSEPDSGTQFHITLPVR